MKAINCSALFRHALHRREWVSVAIIENGLLSLKFLLGGGKALFDALVVLLFARPNLENHIRGS